MPEPNLRHVMDFHVPPLSLTASRACSRSGHAETYNCLQSRHTPLDITAHLQ